MEKLLIIIPAFNEAKALPKLISEIKDYDYIIINDGSTDNTINLPYPMINLNENHGVGYAMQKGYEYAYKKGYDYAIQIDGDGQHNPKEINKLLQKMQQDNADIVIGIRDFNKYKEKNRCFLRHLGIRHIKDTIHKKTGKTVHDPTSGMRLINKNIIEEFINYYPDIAAEPISLYKMIQKNKKISEVIVEMRPRTTGKSFVNFKNIIRYMRAFNKSVKKSN